MCVYKIHYFPLFGFLAFCDAYAVVVSPSYVCILLYIFPFNFFFFLQWHGKNMKNHSNIIRRATFYSASQMLNVWTFMYPFLLHSTQNSKKDTSTREFSVIYYPLSHIYNCIRAFFIAIPLCHPFYIIHWIKIAHIVGKFLFFGIFRTVLFITFHSHYSCIFIHLSYSITFQNFTFNVVTTYNIITSRGLNKFQEFYKFGKFSGSKKTLC